MKIQGLFGEWYDEVLVDGQPLQLAESLAVRNMSPDGFSWGYYGAGPTQLALAILLKAGLPEPRALELFQRFKEEFIAVQPMHDDWVLDFDVKAWADAQEIR